MGKPRLAAVVAVVVVVGAVVVVVVGAGVGAVVVVVVVGAVVVVVVGAVVVAVVVVVVGEVVVVWLLRFQVLVGDESVVVVADVSPMMVSVRPWAVKAPASATSTAAWRNVVVKRARMERP